MISNQVIQTSIDELKTITKVDLCVIDMEGTTVASVVYLRSLCKILFILRQTARLSADIIC